MRFEYTGRHVEVTPALRAHVEEHFKKLHHIFNGSEARAHVILDVEKDRHIGELVVNWREHTFTVKETNRDMYIALTKAIGKLEKQTLKLKKKTVARKRHAVPKATLAPVPGGEIEPAPRPPRIISARSYSIKPMTPDEAALKLANDLNQFLVFRDSDTNQVAVLYKRKDGNYGLVEP